MNVRQAPNASSAVVGSLAQGERVSAPNPEEAGWLRIESASGTSGYVSSKYVRAVEGGAPAPSPRKAKPEPAPPQKPAAHPPIPGTPLARVELGMSESQVRKIIGEPTSQKNYVTGKAWIPHYYGSDASRVDYKYKNVGIVVFSRNRYSGGTSVIRVDYDPNEDGF